MASDDNPANTNISEICQKQGDQGAAYPLYKNGEVGYNSGVVVLCEECMKGYQDKNNAEKNNCYRILVEEFSYSCKMKVS